MINNLNIKEEELYSEKMFYVNDEGKSLVVANFIKYFINL